MNADLQRERAIPISEVPQYLPNRQGRRVHYSTVYRWMTKGVRGKRLESFMVGGVRFTTVEAIHRFMGTSQQGVFPIKKTTCLDEEIEAALRSEGL